MAADDDPIYLLLTLEFDGRMPRSGHVLQHRERQKDRLYPNSSTWTPMLKPTALVELPNPQYVIRSNRSIMMQELCSIIMNT